MKTAAPKPARCLPDWARAFMDEWRHGSRRGPVPIDEQLDHRRAAFYRLYGADGGDVRAMWDSVARNLAVDEDRIDFLVNVILASDAITPDAPLPVYGKPDNATPRLRTREQRHARKLAELLQLLRAVTPPRCRADRSRIMNASRDVEYLVIYFDIGQVPRDYDLRWQRHELGIQFTCDSERGWRQHRRASDKVRARTVRAARALAVILDDAKHRDWLEQLAEELAALPAMQVEHAAWLNVVSQKHGWWNWLAAAHAMTMSDGQDRESPLGPTDWATLASVVTGTEDVTPDDVAHALADMRAHPASVAAFLKNLHGIDTA